MNARHRQQFTSWGVAALLAVAAGSVACVDEKIVFRDAPRFQNPPAAAGNYVGYADTTAKVTACGSCHVEIQGRWRNSGHANAWAGLAANSFYQGASASVKATCESCHAVTALGNADTTTAAGWNSTKDGRYKDVQCESCHGPGLQHASTPNSTNRMLASIRVSTTLKDGCGECHEGTHHPYTSEWQSSLHGSGASFNSTRTREACVSCHTAQGALDAFGVNATTSYKEKGLAAGDTLRIVCAVCHDPHGNGTQGALRFPIDVPDEDRNLCMKCHHKRGVPDQTSQTRGAHSPQGPLILGQAGWWPDGFTLPGGVERIIGTHGSDRNPKLCAGCHMGKFTANGLTSTGHTFKAIPCVNTDGTLAADQNCTTFAQRTFKDCVGSGCHSSEDNARAAQSVVEARLATLSNTLAAMIALTPASESRQDSIYTVREGASFNLSIGRLKGSAAHNPWLTEALLNASIIAVRDRYGVTVPAAVNLENTLMEKKLATHK